MFNNVMQGIWGWMRSKLPQNISPDEIMRKAMEAGKANGTPSSVIGVMEDIVSTAGCGDRLNNPEVRNILDSFKKQQDTGNIIPHAVKLAKEFGIFPNIMSFFGGK